MSADDRDYAARLPAAARRDVAADEAEREGRICERVLAAGSGGGEAPSSPRSLRPWGGLTAAGFGALVMVGAGAFALVSPKSGTEPTHDSTDRRPAPAQAISETNVISEPSPAKPSPVEPAVGTSVWELPAADAPKATAPLPSAAPDTLALELAALERARKTLREHDAAGAAALLDEFDRRFPRPRTGDEAVVLRVEVLIALGRSKEARRLGTEFLARHPDSIYRARIAQLLGDGSQ